MEARLPQVDHSGSCYSRESENGGARSRREISLLERGGERWGIVVDRCLRCVSVADSVETEGGGYDRTVDGDGGEKKKDPSNSVSLHFNVSKVMHSGGFGKSYPVYLCTADNEKCYGSSRSVV